MKKMEDFTIKGVNTWNFRGLFHSLNMIDLFTSTFYLENSLSYTAKKNEFKRFYNLFFEKKLYYIQQNFFLLE